MPASALRYGSIETRRRLAGPLRVRFAACLCLVLAGAGASGPRVAGAGEPVALRVAVPAEVLSLRDVRVPAEVSGRVVERPDDETATVKAGAVVVRLDDVLLAAQARGAHAAAERARARLDWARSELERERGLRAQDSVGAAVLERAEVAVREAAAGLEAAEAAAAEAATRLDRTRIRAPFDGQLVRIAPERGEYLRVGETAFRIVDLSGLRIVAYVPADRVGAIRPGQVVSVRAALDAADRLMARVFSVAPAAEGRARTFRVEARVALPARPAAGGDAAAAEAGDAAKDRDKDREDPDKDNAAAAAAWLRPGMTAEIHFRGQD